MTQATAGGRPHDQARSDRRLGVGIAISVALHGLLLSLQFGVPGLDLGGGGPISITLAPSTSPLPPLPPLPPPPLPAAPIAAAPPPQPPIPPAAPAPTRGLRLVDRPAPPVVQAEARPPKQTRRPKRSKPAAPKRTLREVPTPVIAAAPDLESEFTVPVPLPDIVPEPAPEAPVLADSAEGEVPAQADEIADAGPDLAAQEAEEERQRQLERQALEQERLAQAEREAAEARLAQEREAERLQAQAAQEQVRAQAEREQAELLRQQELAARQRADEEAARLARQQEQEQERERELAERQRLEAQRLAQEAAERRRLDELAERQLEQQRAQALAQELARQQAERAAQQQAREQAERLARQQAEEAARQAAAQQKQGTGLESMPVGPGVGQGAGRGAGSGSQPGAGSLAGMPGSRARELLRGVTIPNVTAPVAPAERAMGGRRVLADGGERDAPLRLYVDSVRQKLERNAVMGGARLALQDVRIDPLVSLSLRSDGSIDEVTIVRSSGRADMDEAVRRFVRLNARYSAFPPNVAARFDIIEIRRIWRFTDGLKLIEEMR